jgi:hypothetical protein
VLHWVCALGDLAKANAVLSIPGVQVNEQDNAGWTPLMIAGMGWLGCMLIAVSAGKEDIAERLLEGTEVDVLLQNRNGATALYSLCGICYLTKGIMQQVKIGFTYPSPPSLSLCTLGFPSLRSDLQVLKHSPPNYYSQNHYNHSE